MGTRLIPALAVIVGIASSAYPPIYAQPPQNESVTPYRVNPGDELEIFVWGEERLQRKVRVLPDGTFVFPLIGQISALNRLPTDIAGEISSRLKSQYSGAVPQVTVSVVSPAGMQFSVVGKVRNPGTFSPTRYMNALEALSLAGGPTEFAELGNVLIIRKSGNSLITIRVKLNDMLKGSPAAGDLSPGRIPQIQGGDTVIVP
jgi:polysaccharide biosynthesis/export protein